MIAAQNTHVLDSNIVGRSVEMSLDVDSLQKIMNRLTDLYSDRILACIREISTNARDSHIEARNPAPIEVFLPTPLDSYLRIQDRGTGLSADEFIEVYSKYGKSTRDGSNDYAGMMGLGCKAPLTYTSQYTIYSVKNGIGYEVLITRNEAGTNTITVVSETPTDEANGVMVEIMVKNTDVNAFRDRAKNFYRFWKPGTVLIDGEEPTYISGTAVGENMLIIQDYNRRNYVIMDNVAYPVAQSGEWAIDHGLNNGYTLATHVPMGAVSIPPSREGLSEDKHTRDALTAITEDFHKGVAKSIQRDINNCRSPYQALNAMMKWGHILPKSSRPTFGDYKFQGRTIPEKIDLAPLGGAWLIPHSSPTRRGSGGMTAKSHVESIHASDINKRIIFTDWNYASFTVTMRKKLDQWVHDQGLSDGDYSYLLLKQDSFTDKWFDDALVFSWDEVKKIKLESLTVNRGTDSYGNPRKYRIPGSFDVYTESGPTIGYPADDIDSDEPLFWCPGNIGDAQTYQVLVTKLIPTGTLVAVPSNRENKFKRDFPTARHASTVVNDLARAWYAGLDEETRKVMYFQENCKDYVDKIKRLDLKKINDPAFAAYVNMSTIDVAKELQAKKTFARLTYSIVEGIYKGLTMPENPLRKYDLWPRSKYESLSAEQFPHFYVYVNAIYGARLAGMEI